MQKRTLEQVDVVELQTLQAELDRVKDVLPALTILVDIATGITVFSTPKALKGRGIPQSEAVEKYDLIRVGAGRDVLYVPWS
jgi:hypothetical protein